MNLSYISGDIAKGLNTYSAWPKKKLALEFNLAGI